MCSVQYTCIAAKGKWGMCCRIKKSLFSLEDHDLGLNLFAANLLYYLAVLKTAHHAIKTTIAQDTYLYN